MRRIRVAAGVLNQTPLDWDGNRDRIRAAIQAAREQQISVLCLPELCVSGYGCEDAFLSADVQRIALDVLLEIVPATHGMIVALGLPLLYQGALYNAACLAVDGQIAGFVGKRNLAGTGIHYEPRWFTRWPKNAQAKLDIGGRKVPVGDLVFDCGGTLFGFEICEDAWVADRVGNDLVKRGVDVILNPSASHFAFGKQQVRERFVLEGSRAFEVAYLYSNLVGNEAGRAIYDGGAMVASRGQLLAQGPRLTFADWHLTSATIDLDTLHATRARDTAAPGMIDPGAISIPFQYELPKTFSEPTRPADWQQSRNLKGEEFARAVALGLFDYLRKSHSQGYVVSISGGVDSAAVTVLAALSLELPAAELGIDTVRERLAHIPQASTAANGRELVEQLVSCAYQATRNSSALTRNAAAGVAAALGAQFHEFAVDEFVQGYIRLGSQAIGRDLSWQTDDIALQNIQARARAPGIWLLANLNRALLLSTSNRSEAAVGYATMDGDTCGGLSPIAGIDKAYLRKWLKGMELEGLAGGNPLPALNAVNEQAPTAELRPPDEHQTDEADLMPYDVLDEIERAAIRDKLSPVEVLQVLEATRPGTARTQLAFWIERFFRLWCRNQWKRERYAPSFHLDDENLDPKTWCRFPILSGGYERELRELRAYLTRTLE